MKIAFFTDTYHPQINGVVTAIDDFVKELGKLGHEVHIFCPKDKDFKPSTHVHGLPSVKFHPYPEYRIGLPSHNIVNTIKQIKPDIIHIHTPASVGLMGLAIAKSLRLPVVVHYHTLISEYLRYFTPGTSIKAIKNIDTAIVNKYTKWFYNQSNLTIVPSMVMEEYLKKIGVSAPIKVIPNGVEILPLKKKPHNKVPIILHVGRICREKRIDVVVHAFAEILKDRDAKLIITSKGPSENDLKSLVHKMGLEDKVIFTGYISEKEKRELYRKADIFAFASITETQGLVVLEAMVAGTPVVAARGGGTLDYVKDGDTGLLFEEGDYKELARNVKSLLDDRSLRNGIVKSGLKMVKGLSVKDAAKKLENGYKTLEDEKISIIIPTYLEEKYIENTLKSLQNQTYKNFEIIVSDSNSSDKTRTIAKNYADKVVNVKQRGIGLGRNRGAKVATGGIILFLDADTILEPNFLENVLGAFRSRNVALSCGMLKSDGSLSARFIFWGTGWLAWILSKIGYPVMYGMCLAVRKSVFDRVGGFNESLNTAEDVDFTRRASKFGKCVVLRNAIAYTSPRRLKMEGGALHAVFYHILNFFRYKLFGRGSEDYPAIR